MAWIIVKSAGPLGDLERRVDELFAQLIHDPWRGGASGLAWEPAIDVQESPDAYLVLVDLPGVMQSETRVHVEDQTLVVHGRRSSQQFAKTEAVIYAERVQGEFVRRIPLPGPVDRARMRVRFVLGLLIIQLPKSNNDARQGRIGTSSGREPFPQFAPDADA